jgi:hypothetical protein
MANLKNDEIRNRDTKNLFILYYVIFVLRLSFNICINHWQADTNVVAEKYQATGQKAKFL